MNIPEFVYTTYIRSTPEKVWQAITTPEFTRQYWMHGNYSDWKKGSKWEHINSDKKVLVGGTVLESMPPKRLVLSWAAPDDLKDDSKVSFEIEALGDMVMLKVTHGGFNQGSVMAGKVTTGWPLVLSNLKSFLETGKTMDIWAWKKTDCASAKA